MKICRTGSCNIIMIHGNEIRPTLSTAIKACIILSLIILSIPLASAMSMGNMLMGQTLESFLATMVSFGSLSITQKDDILSLSTKFNPDYNPLDEEVALHNHDVFATDESKEALRTYLYTEVETDYMEYDTAETIASMLSLGAMWGVSESGINSIVGDHALLGGPAGSSYSGDGNIVRLGRSNIFGDGDDDNRVYYNGIWGYSIGVREYALQCHGYGLNILDVTDPSNIFRVQFIPMGGGGIWRDVATHVDRSRNHAFAYVGAQGSQGDGITPSLYVIDLSTLSGDGPHSVDENPTAALNLGSTPGFVHTINVDRGLLFLNTQNAQEGCRVYDILANPKSPRFLFNTGGSQGRDCHDSFVMKNADSRDLLVVSDGSGRTQRIWDITDVNENWITGNLPPIIGHTEQISGIFAHSNWASEDNRYLFCFDEGNAVDMAVHDISNPTSPKLLGTFQYTQSAQYDGLPHNGEVRGQYLYVAYYKAGLRVFDISNPLSPYEVGKTETFRDPNGDGVLENPYINEKSNGAWNTYPFLPSKNVLVSDMVHGLFVVKANPPYDRPGRVSVTWQADGYGNIIISWNAAQNARGYSVLRSSSKSGPFEQIAEHLINTSYTDTSPPLLTSYYKVVAINAEGTTSSTDETIMPTKSPTNHPTAKCGNGFCEIDEYSITCPADCSNNELNNVLANASRGAPGIMFLVKARNRSIDLSAFKFFMYESSSSLVQIYSRIGYHTGFETELDGWEMVYEGIIQFSGNSMIELSLPAKVSVQAETSRSFFIWFESDVRIRYEVGSSEGALLSSDSFVEIYEGVGITSKFGGSYNDVYSPRVFSGVVGYDILALPATPSPTKVPTSKPTMTLIPCSQIYSSSECIENGCRWRSFLERCIARQTKASKRIF